MVNVAFWALCIVAASAHPLILLSYARLFANRKRSIDALYKSTAQGGDNRSLGGVLRAVYEEESNWRGFFVPVTICSILSFAAAAVMIEQAANIENPLGLGEASPLSQYLENANHTAILGFGGAYLASLYGVIDRFRSLTLSTFQLHLAWFRLLFGAAFGAIIANFAAEGLAGPAAFATGFLPIREVLEVVARFARRAFGTEGVARLQEETNWNLVQGATPDIIERLEEADVTSVSALASQNPIALMHRTNIHWRVLIDLMDQAILITYVHDKIGALRLIGIRGAIEAGIVYLRINDRDGAGTVTAVASILGCTEQCARNLIRNLSEDSQVRLLYQLWFDAVGTDQTEKAREPRTLYFVPDDGVSPEEAAATLEALKRFGTVNAGQVVLSADADISAVKALLTGAKFRFGLTS